MASHFRQAQTELERLGYEYESRNTRGHETWKHPRGHSITLSPGVSEDQRRSILRACQKALGIKQQTNKRKVEQVKDRQAKKREIDRREATARLAWVEARIRELELAKSMRQLTEKQQQLLRDRMRERDELRRLMSSTPGWD